VKGERQTGHCSRREKQLDRDVGCGGVSRDARGRGIGGVTIPGWRGVAD
jgi:hypothetical protein